MHTSRLILKDLWMKARQDIERRGRLGGPSSTARKLLAEIWLRWHTWMGSWACYALSGLQPQLTKIFFCCNRSGFALPSVCHSGAFLRNLQSLAIKSGLLHRLVDSHKEFQTSCERFRTEASDILQDFEVKEATGLLGSSCCWDWLINPETMLL